MELDGGTARIVDSIWEELLVDLLNSGIGSALVRRWYGIGSALIVFRRA